MTAVSTNDGSRYQWRQSAITIAPTFIGEVTPDQLSHHNRHTCGRTEFLRRLGHEKGRVQMPYPNPEGISYYYFVPSSYVAFVETSINTTRNRYEMCTHPTGGNPQYVPKPRIWYLTTGIYDYSQWYIHDLRSKNLRYTYNKRTYNIQTSVKSFIIYKPIGPSALIIVWGFLLSFY